MAVSKIILATTFATLALAMSVDSAAARKTQRSDVEVIRTPRWTRPADVEDPAMLRKNYDWLGYGNGAYGDDGDSDEEVDASQERRRQDRRRTRRRR
jgi:hypothetical protein